MTWLLNSADQSLALILADNGYDVWIANTRGTRFSRRHVSLDPSNPVHYLPHICVCYLHHTASCLSDRFRSLAYVCPVQRF